MKDITIVIPNLNGMRWLEGCLGSLRKQTDRDFETILIDNGSDDGSVDFVRERFPEVKVRAYHRNTGFCRAVNAGIRMSRLNILLIWFSGERWRWIRGTARSGFSRRKHRIRMIQP